MFNINTTTYNNTVNIKPACMGMMQKSHPKSFFRRFAKGSPMEDWIFSDTPCIKEKNRYDCWQKVMDVIVLQTMVFGDNQFLVELLNVEDLE